MNRRTPQGVRGLKWFPRLTTRKSKKSHPARGAWIEIGDKPITHMATQSHPARGAWIEMWREASRDLKMRVAPRKGCVD